MLAHEAQGRIFYRLNSATIRTQSGGTTNKNPVFRQARSPLAWRDQHFHRFEIPRYHSLRIPVRQRVIL